MKRSNYIFLLIIFILFISACRDSGERSDQDSDGNYDFRKTHWGMTMDQVRSSEPNQPISENENVITYKESYLDIPVLLGYIFADGKLVKAGYIFRQGFYEPDLYIESNDNIKLAVIKQLGPPMLDEVKWVDEEKTDELDFSGKAVCQGEVLYLSNWIDGNTFASLRLDSEEGKCRQGLIYESREYQMQEAEGVDELETLN